jgi:hypothetical protein
MKYGNYDSWKLATPWDDEPEMPEVYETEKYGYFHTDEELIEKFDRKVKKFEMLEVPSCYVSQDEYIEELAGNLSYDLDLYTSQDECLIAIAEKERDEYEAAMEQKAEYKREAKRLKGWL